MLESRGKGTDVLRAHMGKMIHGRRSEDNVFTYLMFFIFIVFRAFGIGICAPVCECAHRI